MVCERLDTDFKERLQALKDCSNTLDKHKGTVEILLRDIECQVGGQTVDPFLNYFNLYGL